MDDSRDPSDAPAQATATTPSSFSRFTSKSATADDQLKSQTIGLVQYSELRKRRAEAIEAQEREQHEAAHGGSGASTPRDGALTPQPAFKKKKKNVAKGKLSFGLDEEEDDGSSSSRVPTPLARSKSNTPAVDDMASDGTATPGDSDAVVPKRKLGPNSSVSFTPKAMTKSALQRDAETREKLRKEYMAMQELVKATEIVVPFVFYDGSDIPGGRVKIKKGEHIFYFLDKARKVGAELGVGGDKGRREWARVNVDDLMFVRDEIIIPHHYEFYYFLVNKAHGFHGRLFSYSAEPTSTTPSAADLVEKQKSGLSTYDPLSKSNAKTKEHQKVTSSDAHFEGYNDDPGITKVVDRRWYERNKHIYPASIWEEFDPEKDYSKGVRKDTEGNSFFFS